LADELAPIRLRGNIARPASDGKGQSREESGMADFKVRGFNHTSFTVASLERAISFFRDLLGFELISRAPRGQALIEQMTSVPGAEIAFLRGPDHTLELVEYKAPADRAASRARLCDAGAAHIALDVDQVDAAVAAALAYEYRPVGEIIVIDAGPNRGRQVVYLKGPDGIVVEFIGDRPA
jgi:catechol 2,3-dioxygenase-like lactoylglutathione lyase family enzyme